MYYTHSHTLLLNLGGLYFIWRASLGITLGGIRTLFPSKIALFHLNPKKVCRGINSDKNCPYNIFVCYNNHHTRAFQIWDHLVKVGTL